MERHSENKDKLGRKRWLLMWPVSWLTVFTFALGGEVVTRVIHHFNGTNPYLYLRRDVCIDFIWAGILSGGAALRKLFSQPPAFRKVSSGTQQDQYLEQIVTTPEISQHQSDKNEVWPPAIPHSPVAPEELTKEEADRVTWYGLHKFGAVFSIFVSITALLMTFFNTKHFILNVYFFKGMLVCFVVPIGFIYNFIKAKNLKQDVAAGRRCYPKEYQPPTPNFDEEYEKRVLYKDKKNKNGIQDDLL